VEVPVQDQPARDVPELGAQGVGDDGAITGIGAYRFDPGSGRFVDTPVPRVA